MSQTTLSPAVRFPEFHENWNKKDVGSIAKTITSGSRDWAQYYSKTGSKFIRMTNLPRGGIQLLLDDIKFVELPEDSSEGKRTSLEANDILISITAELGKIGWIPLGFGTAYINQHTALLRLDLNRADARFIAHLLSSQRMNNQINSLNDAGAKAGLNLPTIRTFPLHLPTLPEQRKIADFLTAVDGRIQQLSQKKALLEDYKKGVMQQLFTQTLRFKDDHGNGFPDWEEKTLEDIGRIIRGSSPRPQGDARYYGGLVPRLMVQDVTRDGKWVTPRIDSLTEAGAKLSRPCPAGTLTIVCSGTVGVVSFLAVDACIHDGFLALVEIDESAVTKDFLFHRLNTLREQFEKGATHGGVFTNLTTSGIKEFKIKLPSLPEQTKIASFLTALDRKIESVAGQITHTQAFKKGLLQQMFV